jgi:hypothetical protein
VTDDNDLPDDRLVDEFTRACLRAGRSNSGLVIDPRAEADLDAARGWKAALLRRLRRLRETPPSTESKERG